MSFILDALRKSERERRQSVTAKLHAAPGAAKPPTSRVPWLAIFIIVLLVNSALVLMLVFQNHTTTDSPPAEINVADQTVNSTATRTERPAVRSLSREANTRQSGATQSQPVTQALTQTLSAEPVNQDQLSNEQVLRAPPYEELPPEIRIDLPLLHLDVHGYAADPANRFVLINLRRYKEGDTLPEGPVVKRITPDGALLEYREQLFLLSPN
ncbi:MAG: general secretion pathway protein GspB [Gammaproteobacteria bacterium]|nr:general secretion pathway protein GspB [Gammaproteobacteria bacterium]